MEDNLLLEFDAMIKNLSALGADVILKHCTLALGVASSTSDILSMLSPHNRQRLVWAESNLANEPSPKTQTLAAEEYWLKRWRKGSEHQESLELTHWKIVDRF